MRSEPEAAARALGGPPRADAAAPARALTVWDALGIGINGIVGSGIYVLVSGLAARAGAASVVGVVACGLLCVLIALCYAELSSMFDRSGGPYLYARAAFGPVAGFVIGWLGAAVGVLGLAAVASVFASTLLPFLPAAFAQLAGARFALALLTICALGAINYLGVKAGGRTSLLLSAVKILPLVALALLSLRFVSAQSFLRIFHAPEGKSWPAAVASAAFYAIFMTSGFEYASVAAGETKDPKRAVPIAILGSLLGASALYALLQLGALAAVPDLATHEHPLQDVAWLIAGEPGRRALAAAALVSMLGYCSGVAIVAPRYFLAMAEDGYLPAGLLAVSRFRTPGAAILAATALSCALVVLRGYASLVDAANVVILSGYVLTALAALVLRLRRPEAPRGVRLPFGIAIPLLAITSGSLLLWFAEAKLSEWLFTLELTLIGAAVWGATRLWRALRPARG